MSISTLLSWRHHELDGWCRRSRKRVSSRSALKGFTVLSCALRGARAASAGHRLVVGSLLSLVLCSVWVAPAKATTSALSLSEPCARYQAQLCEAAGPRGCALWHQSPAGHAWFARGTTELGAKACLAVLKRPAVLRALGLSLQRAIELRDGLAPRDKPCAWVLAKACAASTLQECALVTRRWRQLARGKRARRACTRMLRNPEALPSLLRLMRETVALRAHDWHGLPFVMGGD